MGDVLSSMVPWTTDCEIANRIDRKVFLANERTLNSWFRTAVTLGTAGAAVVGCAPSSPGHAHGPAAGCRTIRWAGRPALGATQWG